MKKTIAMEIADAIANGAVKVPSNKFLDKDGNPIKVRPMDGAYDPLEVGDIIHVPNDFEVLAVKFNADDEDAHPCIICEVTLASGGERNIRFFPNSLCKSVISYDADGHRGPRVKSSGTAGDLFRTKDTVDEGLALLRGRDIKVSAYSMVTIKDYRSKEMRDTHIYTYDLVD